MIRKIYDAIQTLIILYTFFIAMLGLGQLAKETVKEMRFQIRRRSDKDITRYEM